MSVRVLCGDARTVLATLPAASVQCCVTSPPYFGLRSYLTEDHADKAQEMGSEATPEAYIAALVAVFRELRRVLRDDGTCWLNIGDSYCSTDKWGGGVGGNTGKHVVADGGEVPSWAVRQRKAPMPGVKPKDLLMMPARVAIALQADGWWLRSDIIWHKPNPMPESVTDRPTSSHEHVFLLAKRPAYYFDAEAVREDRTKDEDAATFRGGYYVNGNIDNGLLGKRQVIGNRRIKVPGGWDRGAGAHGTIHRDGRTSAEYQEAEVRAGRNIRNVWTIATAPYPEAHFATFPPELAERCIKAGSRPGDTILDPFGGAGTTALVADRLGRDALLIELNPAYCALAERRIVGDAPLFAQVAAQ